METAASEMDFMIELPAGTFLMKGVRLHAPLQFMRHENGVPSVLQSSLRSSDP